MASYMIHRSLVEKPLKIYDYWPLRSDKRIEEESGPIVMDDEMFKQIKKTYNLK